MSTTTDAGRKEQDRENAKEEVRAEVELEFYAEKVLAELPQHFQEHSHYWVDGTGSQILRLIPEEREESGILFHEQVNGRVLRDNKFERGTLHQSEKGAGVALFFNLSNE